MIERLTSWLYARLGVRYWLVLIAGQGGVSTVVAVVTLFIISRFYDATVGQVALLCGIGAGLTMVAIAGAVWKSRREYREVVDWATGSRSAEGAVAAWHAASTFTLRQFRQSSFWVNVMVVVPSLAVAIPLLGLGLRDLAVLLLAAIAPAAYATFLSYSVGEELSRPMVADIAAHLPDDFAFERDGLPLCARVQIGVPIYTVTAGLLVATLLGGHRGASSLLLAVAAAVGVGLLLSFELANLLGRAITQPVDVVREAMEAVSAGDLTVRVPVLSSDELGALAHDFNQMTRGLQEREELRAAFGTYVDKEVVALILSGQFPREGLEVDVSILFCDVRGFTTYAENAAATAVISALNRLFALIVPIVEGNGGHIDKFIGDGLLAVFGAPEIFEDHADRAFRAACEIVEAVREADLGLSVAAGVNSGIVVAGSVGGAGRLNFSVIGDVVNVAARVEAATRETGDDVLITAATRERLGDASGLVSRGSIPLKGKAQPLELFAPAVSAAPWRPGPARLQTWARDLHQSPPPGNR